MELALVTPILLLLFAAAADFGRAFYAYVALENAVKEGALFGSRSPACDTRLGGFGCEDPDNVTWRVQNELQGLTNPDGKAVEPTSQCTGDCTEGDTYTVEAEYSFRLITPILGSILGDGLTLRSVASSTVLNAEDPTPGVSVQKYVSLGEGSNEAINKAEIVARCTDPADQGAPGFYRSPCYAPATQERLNVRFDAGTTVTWRMIVANSGVLNLTGVSITDTIDGSSDWPDECSPYPTSLPIGAASYACTYELEVPDAGTGSEVEFTNVLTADADQILPATDFVTVVVERPADLRVLVFVSPYAEGDDGDGEPSFGTIDAITVGLRAPITPVTAWYRVVVDNVGGRAAIDVVVTDAIGALPETSACPRPTSLDPGDRWVCTYARSPIDADGTYLNTVTATATDERSGAAAGAITDSGSATVTATPCTANNDRVIPNMIDRTKAEAEAAWGDAEMTGTLTAWIDIDPDLTVMTQSRQAYSCVRRNSDMTITNEVTP